MTIAQFRGCTLRRVICLEEPQQPERDELHQHDSGKRSSEALCSQWVAGFPLEMRIVAHRRSHASRAPSAINKPPVTRSSHALTVGRVSTAPMRSTNHAYA